MKSEIVLKLHQLTVDDFIDFLSAPLLTMIWTHEIDHYSQEDRQHISKLEQQLLHEYQELKSDIEDNELRYNLIFTRPFSSYLLPKDPQHLAKERRIFLERLSHVETSPNIQFLSDEIREELDSATNSDYTAESLSILLHEYYLKRLSSLTYAKTLHCVRWKRFCRYYTNFDHVQKQFKLRSNRILAEFNDALQRTQRLRSVRESLLSSSATAKQTQQLLIADDYISFVRQLVCQYRGSKYFDQFTQLIRLSHLKFRTKLSSEQTDIINLEPPSMQNLSFTFPSSVHTKSSNLTILNANKLPTIDIEQKQTLEKLKPLLKQYSIPYDIDKIKTMGDEMELYATIIRHFRTLFYKQEQEIPRFKYDSAPANIMNMSRQSSVYKLLKSSPWTKFIDIYPEKSPQVERDYCRYKIRSNTNAKNDELLKMISKFVRVHNADKATNVLKQYLIAVKTKQNGAIQRLVQNASGQSAIADIFWRNIFEVTKDQNNNNDDDNQTDEIEDDGNFHDDDAKSARYMKRDEFNYTETLQKLGLDDTGMHDDNEDDASESYGLQLSFITLRLLRIRELRTQCLHEYNYIRSLQRTMTIYEQHLTIIPENKKSSKSEELRSIDARFGSRKIPHTYLFDAPDQCTIDDLNFMESGEETENFEDFFHFDDNNDNCVHVQDPLGFHIIYDCAIDDVQQLEDEIISIGSYFIEKECVLHPPSSDGSSIDYTRKIDRFEVLCNLWELEQKYLYYKRQLLDCYYEVYQHTFDANERKCLSKIITDIVAMRPKIDFKNSSYFIQSYNIEIRILIVKLKILKEYINRHVRDMRLMCDNLIETESEDYGSYLSTGIKKPKPPSIFLSASKIRNYYLFEYIESLSSISRIPSILTQTINELLYFEQIQNRTQNTTIYQLLYELEYMDYLYTTYSTLEKPGHTFSQANQRDIFNSVYSENPQVVAQLATEILKQIDDTRTTKKEQYDKFTKLSTQLIDIINLRYRLVKSASECEILTMIYKQQTDVMNIDHSHLYMRYIQFEFAQQKNITITSATETSDGRLDKITQQNMLFAIQELEEGQIGRINFRNKEQWQSYINDGEDAVANLRAALKAQLIHNNCVHIAIYQHRLAIICITNQLSTMKMRANSAMTPVEENKTGRTHINTGLIF
ncbi:unnamed protein product [Didymodactylos carnosus]|uniref:DUF4549 domain-containing protein n=1 Tax=Didymodactylos carnosus TaxID=1234261 RepID=A0A8S2GZV2_9BILA|nr:unnamed protein product [Didymodactylos carnosus]CAF3577806.1 unnamed protein product [Didymodactylos carnosus]